MLSQFAVNELFERWPALSQLAHISLAELPSPVEELSRVSDKVDSGVWIKRDDLSARRYGRKQGAQTRVSARARPTKVC